jgi:hypothetical protein
VLHRSAALTLLSAADAVVQAHSASLGVVAGICQVLLAVWQVLGPCSMLQMEAVLQSVLLRLADGERIFLSFGGICLHNQLKRGCMGWDCCGT